MQPLFAQNPLFRNVLPAGYVIWAVTEVILGMKQITHLRTGAQLQDKGSRAVVAGTVGLGILLCLLLPHAVPATTITSASVFVFWLGVALVYAGLAFRLYAITVLGRYFTLSVAVVADQQVVEDGPYKLIRHPSYTGLLIMFLGFGLSSNELVEPVGPDGMCADWFELPYPCGRARPAGASGPAVSGVYAAHKTAHPLCPVTEDKLSSRPTHPLLRIAGARLGKRSPQPRDQTFGSVLWGPVRHFWGPKSLP